MLQVEMLLRIGRHQRLVGRLIYLTITCPDITCVVGVLNQFMHATRKPHWEAVCHILRYLKGALGKGFLFRPSSLMTGTGFFFYVESVGNHIDRWSTSSYCMFVGGNLVTWRSKKHNVVAHSGAKAEYRAMTHTACEML
jgi:hypothetical protein